LESKEDFGCISRGLKKLLGENIKKRGLKPLVFPHPLFPKKQTFQVENDARIDHISKTLSTQFKSFLQLIFQTSLTKERYIAKHKCLIIYKFQFMVSDCFHKPKRVSFLIKIYEQLLIE